MSEVASESHGSAERTSHDHGGLVGGIPHQATGRTRGSWQSLSLPFVGSLPRRPARWRRLLPAVEARVMRLLQSIDVGPRTAMTVAGTGLLFVLVIGAAAPNASTVHIRGPLSVLPSLPTAVAFVLVEAAIVLEALGLVFMLWAYARGWRPDARKLFWCSAAFVAVMVNLAPVGSSDSASYAAYGRMFDLGHDVYMQGPLSIGGGYARIVDIQWLNTSSVYGPIATWVQALGAFFGQNDPARTIWFLMVTNGAVFLFVGWLLLRYAKEPARATLLWTANPLIVHQLVAGGHLDTFVAAAGVCAVLVARRYALAGTFVALGAGFKVSAGLLGAGFFADRYERRDWSGLTRFATALAIVVLLLYGLVGLHALNPLSSASGMIATVSPWHLVSWLGSFVLGSAGAHRIVQVGWPIAMFIFAAKLRNRAPEGSSPLVRVQFALAFAWILAAPWVLPWYTAPAWAFMAMLPRTRLVGWLVAYSFLLAVLHASGGTPAGYRTSAPERVARLVSTSDGSGPPVPRPASTGLAAQPTWGAASFAPAVTGPAASSFAVAVAA